MCCLICQEKFGSLVKYVPPIKRGLAAKGSEQSMATIWHNEKYGKPILIGVSLLIWIGLGTLFKTYGYEAAWRLWNVPTRMPPFVDFRLIPSSAESFRMGFEPSIQNPGDPEKHIFNYPAFWRIFFYSNITQADTVWIVVVMLMLYFLGAFLFPGQLTVSQAIWMLVVLFSPASMLLYERGNVDLIVFFICTMIVVSASYSAYVASLLIAFGTIIKFFPFFGITVLLKEQKHRFWWLFAGCMLVLVVYMLASVSSVNASWNLTMRGFEISYGTNVLFRRYEHPILGWLEQYLPSATAFTLVKFGPTLAGPLILLIVAFYAVHSGRELEASDERNLAAFRMGASIYIGTFLLGNNWDYRLAFLVFVIPQLYEWTRSPHAGVRSAAALSMLSLLLSCWHFIAWYSPLIHPNFVLLETTFILDECINWILMMTLADLFILSLPDWMKADLRRFLPQTKMVELSEQDTAWRFNLRAY